MAVHAHMSLVRRPHSHPPCGQVMQRAAHRWSNKLGSGACIQAVDRCYQWLSNHGGMFMLLGAMPHLKALQGAISPPVVHCNTDGGCKLDRDASFLQDISSRLRRCLNDLISRTDSCLPTGFKSPFCNDSAPDGPLCTYATWHTHLVDTYR